tara:strand:+ start:1322 stop:1618 length:297 start_codon:yes stop_codon:yes gene_type:complete
MSKIIYKFLHNENSYIGSTTNLKMRCFAHNQHKKQERHKNIKLYKYCNSEGIDDLRPFIEILEVIEEEISKEELREKEQQYLNQNKPNLNMIKAKRNI